MSETQAKLYTHCPYCTEIREKAKALETSLENLAEFRRYVPRVSDLNVHCEHCDNRQTVFTEDGLIVAQLIEDRFTETILELQAELKELRTQLEKATDVFQET